MARVTATEVRAIMGEPDSAIVDPHISVATVLVDDTLLDQGLSDPTLKNIELYLSAHFALLTLENGPLAKKMVGEANEGYHNVYKGGLASTRFGQQALLLDSTGLLAELSDRAENPQRKTAQFEVVGTPPTSSW